MELRGEYTLSAEADVIWAALNDPELLEACIPDCEFVEKISDTEMRIAIGVEIGPVKTRFSGKVSVSEPHPPRRWTLRGDGRGSPSGTAKGYASVELVDAGGGKTTLSYLGSADLGGKFGELAKTAVETFARRIADEFVARLAAELDKSSERWVDQLDHSMAAVQLGDEPSEDVVIDKEEIGAETVDEIEEQIELAAGRQWLGGAYVWGLLALILLVIILVVLN